MEMIILQDHREKVGQHDLVESELKSLGYTLHRVRLNVGDYMFPQGTKSVDLKKNLEELASDLHRDKLALNKKYKKCLDDGIKLTVLVEEDVSSLNDLLAWESNHSRINGAYLFKMIRDVKLSYGVSFAFCSPKKTAQKLLEILKEK